MMKRHIANALVWVFFLSGMYGVVAFHSSQHDEANGLGRAKHDPNCRVCRQSGKSLPDEIGPENVQSFLPHLVDSD